MKTSAAFIYIQHDLSTQKILQLKYKQVINF